MSTFRRRAWRVAANLATLANGLCGLGAISYVLLGNKVFALFLILAGVGWDGLDGFFSRRAGGGESVFGRVADSVSDAVTFCVAPGLAVAVNYYDVPVWSPYTLVAWTAGGAIAAVGLARLVYYTLVAYRRQHFSGASTPQNAMWVVVLLLLFQFPGFLGEQPLVLLPLVILFVPLMVLPLRYPKMRRGAPLRRMSSVMAAALSVSLIAASLLWSVGSVFRAFLYPVAFAGAVVAFALLLVFYLAGPLVTPKEVNHAPHQARPAP